MFLTYGILAIFGIDDLIVAVVIAAISVGASTIQQQQAKKAQEAAQKKAREQQAKAGLQLAGQELATTKEEMTMQVGQRKIQGLMEALEQQPAAPRILMLPSAAPEPTWVDRFNQSIDSLIRGG
jgi:translation initiation factor 2 alpha subunit (eIF-2alpha)